MVDLPNSDLKISQAELSSCFFVRTFPVGPLGCNCVILGDAITRQAIVADPGGDAERIAGILREAGLTLTKIIHTHAHFDHFLASGDLHELTGAPLCLHPADKPLWEHLEAQCARFHIPFKPVPELHQWLADEESLSAGALSGVALWTPGHTPGSMSFWFEDVRLLVAGDTLFKGGIGRTDLWGGDSDAIIRSIRERLYTLDEEAVVIAGHGPTTTIGEEKQGNPYVRG